ncbi:MAG: hypothetical protein WCR52_14955 [Bacteroidota bacterium]
MKKIAFAALVLMLGLGIMSQSACYYDNEQDLYGITPGSCDTTGIKYSTYIKSLVAQKCTSCHAIGASQESSPMETYDNLKVYVDNGKFLDRINSATNYMPASGQLPECDRKKIEAWIKAGALNN